MQFASPREGPAYAESDFTSVLTDYIRGRLTAIKALADSQKQQSGIRNKTKSRMEDITALADTTLDILDSFMWIGSGSAVPHRAEVQSYSADRFLRSICDEVRPRARIYKARLFLRRPPEHMEVTADLFLLRRALVNLLSVAARHGAGGSILLMLYEACGNTVIEVSYKESAEADNPSECDKTVAQAVDLSDARTEIELDIAELVAKNHQGKLSVLRRRSRNEPGTTLRLEFPSREGGQCKTEPVDTTHSIRAAQPGHGT